MRMIERQEKQERRREQKKLGIVSSPSAFQTWYLYRLGVAWTITHMMSLDSRQAAPTGNRAKERPVAPSLSLVSLRNRAKPTL